MARTVDDSYQREHRPALFRNQCPYALGYRCGIQVLNAALGHISAVAGNGCTSSAGSEICNRCLLEVLQRGEKECVETDTDEAVVTDGERIHCVARAYHVFNADQVDGFIVPICPPMPESQRIAEAERFLRKTGARIFENGSQAYYDSKCDEIYMPPFALFKRPDLFYSTLAHECVHYTGHIRRDAIDNSRADSARRPTLSRN